MYKRTYDESTQTKLYYILVVYLLMHQLNPELEIGNETKDKCVRCGKKVP